MVATASEKPEHRYLALVGDRGGDVQGLCKPLKAEESHTVGIRPSERHRDGEEQYERVEQTKDAHGVTWLGLLLRRAADLDSGGPLQSEE